MRVASRLVVEIRWARGWPSGQPARVELRASPGRRTDDRGQAATARAAAEGRRGRLLAGGGRGRAADPDGERRGGPDRRRPTRALARAAELPEWLPRSHA